MTDSVLYFKFRCSILYVLNSIAIVCNTTPTGHQQFAQEMFLLVQSRWEEDERTRRHRQEEARKAEERAREAKRKAEEAARREEAAKAKEAALRRQREAEEPLGHPPTSSYFFGGKNWHIHLS